MPVPPTPTRCTRFTDPGAISLRTLPLSVSRAGPGRDMGSKKLAGCSGRRNRPGSVMLEDPPSFDPTRSETAMRIHVPEFISRHKLPTAIAIVLALPVLVFTLWAAITLNYTYSRGERAGFLQKISKKGWICKTWE